MKNLTGWQIVFFIALLVHFTCCMAGWNHSLLEHHSYRQSQTAMAVEYMIRDHAWINYKTPVLGPPWQIPLEFPLYQMIVAGLCIMLKSPIEQTGRAVSLIFFYACLWPMNLYLRYLVPETKLRFMILSLVLLAPIYIYFSRVVMIESTALFFGFSFLVLSARQLDRPSLAGMILMLACGSICALVKITTFCAFGFPCLILPLLTWLEREKGNRPELMAKWVRQAKVLVPAYGVPLLAGVWWTHRADAIKMASPATTGLTSSGLSSWNFGSLAQRLEPEAWSDLLVRLSFSLTFFPFLIAVFVAVFFLKASDRRIIALLVVAAFLPVLVFFNLHVVHDYYFYASSVFLIFAIGYVLACLLRTGNKWGKLLWVVIAVSFLSMYGFVKNQGNEDETVVISKVVQAVQANSGEDDYLLIYGEVWDSRIPYHAKRKAFMNYFFDPVKIRDLDTKMEQVPDWNKIRLAIINTKAMAMTTYLQDRLKAEGFAEIPDLSVPGFAIYRRATIP